MVGLAILDLFVGPWIVLLAYGLIPGLGSRDPLGKGLESAMYPAIRLAETSEFYGDYFWRVLEPLGG